ncbi:MAG TPA: GNAT family N-acetyltransferase [Vicinamibacterales bacterium]|jgi:FemAB-related protein (PEP-CTERM system-associated)|nr:GNAT family N-acetyltransferase [Vicinamibacterales bacterium]
MTATLRVDIRALADPGESWNRGVDRSTRARLGHAPAWHAAIARAYGHTPLYLAAIAGDEPLGVLPAFVVRRPLLGTVVTSMPFLDSGGPCGASSAIEAELVTHLVAEARCCGARFVELRSSARLTIDAQPLESKVNMTLPLSDPDALWRRFDKTVRNQVRKAERSGLTIERGGAADLAAFYDVFVERMRDLGSPVHALGFLRHVVEAFGPAARVMLVKHGRDLVGGLVALAFQDRLVVPWSTCRKAYFASCPNMLLYWRTIEAACAEGFTRFEFGRSTRDSGTYRFKKQWGAEEEPLFWYRIPLDASREEPAASHGIGAGVLAKMWQRLPLAVTRQVGPRIRKYLIQ